jgi:hypothetical protein
VEVSQPICQRHEKLPAFSRAFFISFSAHPERGIEELPALLDNSLQTARSTPDLAVGRKSLPAPFDHPQLSRYIAIVVNAWTGEAPGRRRQPPCND